MMEAIPKFIQGVFAFNGAGYDKPAALGSGYAVASDKRAQLIYLRAGNSAPELIYLVLQRDGKPMRYFPLGAKASEHVSLAVVEDLYPDTKLDVLVAAPAGISGTVVVDIGLMEI